MAAVTHKPAAFLLPIGLGAGNIGDELVYRALCQHLAPGVSLDVPVFPLATRQRAVYPAGHRYLPVDARPNGPAALIAGGTITDAEGVHFPLEFLARALLRCHEHGWPVGVTGSGVGPIATGAGRRIFAEAFLPIRHWHVRTARCQENLLDLGVSAARITIAADWAWLYQPQSDSKAWARRLWADAGWNGQRPLVIVNIAFPEPWMREALEQVAATHQLGFFSNEIRPEFELAAYRRLADLGIAVPAAYYAPDEAIAILGAASAVISQRYHTAIEAALAGTPIVLLPRDGEKIDGLAAELGIRTARNATALVDALVNTVDGLNAVDTSRARQRANALVHALPAGAGPLSARRNALVLHAGGLGDLILAADLFATLAQTFHHTTLICRRGLAEVVELFESQPSRVIELDFNPYLEDAPTPVLSAKLRALTGQLTPTDVFLSAEFKPTWLTWFIRAALGGGTDAFTATPTETPTGLLTVLLREFGFEAGSLASPPPALYSHERERYAALANLFTVAPVKNRLIKPPRPEELPRGEYVACFPGGAVQIPLKTWGAERFRAVLTDFPMPSVVVGDAADGAALADAAPPGAMVWAGGPGKLRQVAGVIAHARAWLGNDTGLAHLAQAYGVAGVAVFGGGGGWPAYSPWGAGTLGVVMELACFGCEWACAFGQAHCYEQIPISAVAQALGDVLSGAIEAPAIRRLNPPGSLNPVIMGGAARQHARLRAELRMRLDALLQTEDRANRLAQAAAERLSLIEALEKERQTLQTAATERLRLLEAAHQEINRLRPRAENEPGSTAARTPASAQEKDATS